MPCPDCIQITVSPTPTSPPPLLTKGIDPGRGAKNDKNIGYA